MKYAIETDSLTKMYGDFLAVDNLNMKIKNKSIFGFLGPNGAGKTTTIKMLTCLIKPTEGTAKVGGYDINTSPNEVRQKIGMVPQLVSLYKDLTARENVELCADYYGLTDDEKEDRIDDLMELVDIKYAENKMIKQMSGGQKQKVSVVASLIHRPDVLFLDEPTIGLDPTTKMVLWDLIAELNDNGHTIILCSHDMYEVEMLCENIGIVNLGELVAFDTPQGLKDTLMHRNQTALLKEMKGLSSVGEFTKTERNEKSLQKETIQGVNVIDIDSIEGNSVDSNIIDSNSSDSNNNENNSSKTDQSESKINISQITPRFLTRDPDNHSPEYLAEVQKHTKEISIMVKNMDDKILNDLKALNIVYNVTANESGDGTRLTVAVDRFGENSVNNVIWSIVKNDGNISSINTKDPSLEDVFIDVTGKKTVNQANIKDIDL